MYKSLVFGDEFLAQGLHYKPFIRRGCQYFWQYGVSFHCINMSEGSAS